MRESQSGPAGRRRVDHRGPRTRPSNPSVPSAWSAVPGAGGRAGRRHFQGGQPGLGAWPAVGGPGDGRQGGLPAQDARPSPPVRPGHEVGQVPVPVPGLHQAAVPGLLQRQVGVVPGGEERAVRVAFVGARQGAGAGDGDLVVVAGAAVRGEQVVPGAAAVEVRALDPAGLRRQRDGDRVAGQAALGTVVAPRLEPGRTAVPGAPVVHQVEQPTVRPVVEQRGVEAAACSRTGSDQGPSMEGTVIRWLGQSVNPPVRGDVAVDEVEQAVRVAEAGRPDAAGVRAAGFRSGRRRGGASAPGPWNGAGVRPGTTRTSTSRGRSPAPPAGSTGPGASRAGPGCG
ncbi:hypothetical protein QFZ55_000748 [Streptomyces luteogriseus]|nr:hypothetical protein [Streptomyces luteogriseus]